MQRDSVIALHPTLGMWRGLRDLTGADSDAVYGCVDWYFYHEQTLTECAVRTPHGEPVTVVEPTPQNGAAAANGLTLPGG